MPKVKSVAVAKIPPSKTRKLQAEEARARIITAALTLFASRGFDGASMPQIAKLANASVPLVVYYFQNKDTLWEAAIEKAVEQFDARLKELVKQKDSATERFRQVVTALVKASTEFPEFHRLMLLESHEDSPRLDWLCNRFAKRHHKTMIEIVKNAQQEGGVCKIDPERLLHAVVGMATISSQAAEFKKIARKNLFSATEVKKTVEAIEQLVFITQRQ
ncbi:MAG: TetR/AcrR family transcriptional regulator [Spongiibacteraceae bacterium]